MVWTLLCVLIAPPLVKTSWAQSTLAELTLGVGVRSWTGEVGEALQPGVGFELEQELYLTRSAAEARQDNQRAWTFGAGIKLGVFSFVARPDDAQSPSIPFNGDLQSYHVQVGPRLRRVIWKGLFLKGGVDYVRMNTGGSALVKVVGLKRAWHSGAASLRIGYELEPLVLELEGVHHFIPGLEGSMWGALLRIGVISF